MNHITGIARILQFPTLVFGIFPAYYDICGIFRGIFPDFLTVGASDACSGVTSRDSDVVAIGAVIFPLVALMVATHTRVSLLDVFRDEKIE